MITIDSYNFSGKKALIRVDFNVPLNEHLAITDDTRIRASLPTINKILDDKGAVILMSHLGRPKEGPTDKFSLKHIVKHLSNLLNRDVKFADDCIGKSAFDLASNLKEGEVLLLENLRFYKEETKGDVAFAKKLSELADVYVNDAFGTAHRAHASTTIIAQFFPNNKMFGYLMSKELNHIGKVLNNAQQPFTAILGGAKVSTKINVITHLLDKVDNIIIGGGMAFTFIKAMGGEVGNSLVEEEYFGVAQEIILKAEQMKTQIYLPLDAITANNFSNDADTNECTIDSIPDGWMGLDIGPVSIELFNKVIRYSKTILWNGPMGVFEMTNFENGTKQIAQAIAETTQQGGYSLIGGGDSVAAINQFNLADKVSYISTGGGALLEYLEGIELPGVKAILENSVIKA